MDINFKKEPPLFTNSHINRTFLEPPIQTDTFRRYEWRQFEYDAQTSLFLLLKRARSDSSLHQSSEITMNLNEINQNNSYDFNNNQKPFSNMEMLISNASNLNNIKLADNNLNNTAVYFPGSASQYGHQYDYSNNPSVQNGYSIKSENIDVPELVNSNSNPYQYQQHYINASLPDLSTFRNNQNQHLQPLMPINVSLVFCFIP